MTNEVITHKHEWVRDLFSELDRIAKDAVTVADENQPLLGGEHSTSGLSPPAYTNHEQTNLLSATRF